MKHEITRPFLALLRKQAQEQTAFLRRSARTGKQRTHKGRFAFGLLYGAVALALMASFASLAWPLGQLLFPLGAGALYFLVMELLALLVSVLAGAASSYNSLFQAKDNDQLLALPIPPWMIFCVRFCGLYGLSLFYLLLVWVPTEVVYGLAVPRPLGGILSAVPMALLLAGVASVLAALLGWGVALLTAKAGRHQSLVTVAASLGFLALYYALYQKSGALLNALLTAAMEEGRNPIPSGVLLLLGNAACGDLRALVLLAAVLVSVCAVLGKMLSRPYLDRMTTRTGASVPKAKARTARPESVRRALLRRELLHLGSSPAYLLNCAMGSLGLLVLCGAVMYKAGALRALMAQLPAPAWGAVLAAFTVALAASANCLTAPSVSLEGESFWLIRSLPVTPWQILCAKLDLHLLITLPPALLCAGCLMGVLHVPAVTGLLSVLFTGLFVCLSASIGLVFGVRMPSFHWTSETAVIKQSPFCLLAMFCSWAAGFLLFVGVSALSLVVPVTAGLLAASLLLVLADVFVLRWLRTKGAEKLESYQ